MVVDLFGEGLSMTTVGKVVAGLSVNFSGEAEREWEDGVEREEVGESIDSGSSKRGCPVIVASGSAFSVVGVGMAGVTVPLLRPDIFRMRSRLFFFMGPCPVVPADNGGKPDICRATLSRILSLRDNGAPGTCGILTCP